MLATGLTEFGRGLVLAAAAEAAEPPRAALRLPPAVAARLEETEDALRREAAVGCACECDLGSADAEEGVGAGAVSDIVGSRCKPMVWCGVLWWEG